MKTDTNSCTNKYLIVGGTKGLGLKVAEILSSSNNSVIATGRNTSYVSNRKIKFITLPLDTVSLDSFNKLLVLNKGFNGVCFTQRYRPIKENERNFNEEIQVMVRSIALFMEALQNYNKQFENHPFTRVVIVGSNYATSVGRDQGWEYHTVKAAQLSLVRYFSANSNFNYNINALSPATYIKNGAEDFWNDTQLAKTWKDSPSHRLLSVNEIAQSVITLLVNSSFSISGNNISSDGGMFTIYPDQLVKNNQD